MEKWKKINNFCDYIISDTGKIICLPLERNFNTGKTIEPFISKKAIKKETDLR